GPGLGVEQERMPVQFDLGRRIAQQRQRALEPALADPAPGADHVGPDIDSHAPIMAAERAAAKAAAAAGATPAANVPSRASALPRAMALSPFRDARPRSSARRDAMRARGCSSAIRR